MVMMLLVALLAACKKTDTSNTIANQPVVISYITPGQPITVKLYEQKDIADTTTYGPIITGQSLTVSDGSKTVKLTETAAGTYTYSDVTFLAAGKTYTLQFTYNGQLVSASTVMPTKPTNYAISHNYLNLPSSITTSNAKNVAEHITWDNPDSLYHVIVFQSQTASPYNIHPRMNSAVNFTFNAKQAAAYDVYYSAFNYTGVYNVILYRVNQEYVNQLTSNANATSQQLANPPTNVTNGFGIFTAMQADTLALTLVQY